MDVPLWFLGIFLITGVAVAIVVMYAGKAFLDWLLNDE